MIPSTVDANRQSRLLCALVEPPLCLQVGLTKRRSMHASTRDRSNTGERLKIRSKAFLVNAES